MHNIFVNEYKRAARSVSVADEVFFDSEYHGCEVDAAEILAAVSALPREHCKAFTMFADGYKYEEIAKELGVPLGTVKSRIHTARIRLQRMLRDCIE
jgi:RNA polymerase sigma-70 factor (ECF subfamily)